MDSNLRWCKLHIVNPLAVSALAFPYEIVVIAEGVGTNFLELGLIGALSGCVGWVFCRRIDAATLDIVVDCFWGLLRLGLLDGDILMSRGTASSGIADASASIARVDNTRRSGCGNLRLEL